VCRYIIWSFRNSKNHNLNKLIIKEVQNGACLVIRAVYNLNFLKNSQLDTLRNNECPMISSLGCSRYAFKGVKGITLHVHAIVHRSTSQQKTLRGPVVTTRV